MVSYQKLYNNTEHGEATIGGWKRWEGDGRERERERERKVSE